MKSVSKFALAASLAVTGIFLVSAPDQAVAKKPKAAEAAPAPAARKFNTSKEAKPALVALEKAVKAKDNTAYAAALAAAQPLVTTPDDKYLLAKFQLSHGLDVSDVAEQATALDGVIASGAALPTELPNVYQNIGILAFNSNNWQKAHDAFAKVIELEPNNVDSIVNLSLTNMKLKKNADALPLLERAIAINSAAGKPVPESWYRSALQIAYETHSPKTFELSQAVMAAYPTAENWRNALLVYRDSVRTDDVTNVDILRLMRVSGVLKQRPEFYDLAITLSEGGLPGEAKSVLDEAVRANAIQTNDTTYKALMTSISSKIEEDRASLPGVKAKALAAANGTLALRTADAYYGYGDYASAAELYRAAVSKGSVDADLANLRLGMALAQAGDKAGAEAALKAVTGPRSKIATFWLSWLAKRPA